MWMPQRVSIFVDGHYQLMGNKKTDWKGEKLKRTVFTVIALCIVFVSAATATEFSADMITVMAGGKTDGRIYYKNPNISRSEAMGIISIVKRPLVYQVFTNTKKYVVNDLNAADKKNPMMDVGDFNKWAKKNDLKKVGKETVQGFKCSIYEGSVKISHDQPPVPMKIWYSKKLEYPVKTETTLPAPMGKMINYIENVKLGKQADSLFEVPSGYSKSESVQEAMGMGNFQFQTPGRQSGGASPGQMPSQKDMDKMMKQAQEMMKNLPKK